MRTHHPNPQTPLELALWFSEKLDEPTLEQLRKLKEDGGMIVTEALNVLHVLWNTSLSGAEDGDLVLAARVAADTGYRLRQAALAMGLVESERGGSYLDRGPLLERTEEAIGACRHFLEHHASAEVSS